MASTSGGKEPPDKGAEKYYKCCPKTRVRTLVCVICEAVYHTGHFEQINGAIKLSERLIICQKHPELNITSKLDHVQLSEELKSLSLNSRPNKIYLKK